MEISKVDAAIDYAVEELRQSDVVLDQISEEYSQIVVASPQDDAGFETASTALKRMVRLRNEVEKKRKELKADSTRYGKAVDAEARRIQGLIEPIETHLKTQCDVVRLEQKRLEVEAENKRREQVRGWIDRLNDIGAPVNPDALNVMTADDFEWHFKAALADAEKRNAVQAELEAELEKHRQAVEQEREKHRAELEELRKLREAERVALEELTRAEREAEQAELARLKQIEAERKEAEEEARRIAEKKADEEARQKREAELKPIREQLEEVARSIEFIEIPEALDNYAEIIDQIIDSAAEQIRRLAK